MLLRDTHKAGGVASCLQSLGTTQVLAMNGLESQLRRSNPKGLTEDKPWREKNAVIARRRYYPVIARSSRRRSNPWRVLRMLCVWLIDA